MRVGTPKGPLGEVAVEGEGDRSGFDLPAGHEGLLYGSDEASRGERGEGE